MITPQDDSTGNAAARSTLAACYADPFDSLYVPYESERATFGVRWCGPEKYKSWKETRIARFCKNPGSDGQTVDVYCTAAPARFYTLKVRKGRNSVGEKLLAWEFGTGSSMAELAAKMAEAIAGGMLSLHNIRHEPRPTE